jgi:hypothetical protein
MWTLGQKAEKSGKLPSECIPGIEEIACDWTIWQLDNAIHFFVSVIKNAIEEREQVGDSKNVEWKAKYTFDQLLDDEFRLPRPLTYKQRRHAVGEQVKAMFGMAAPKRSKRKSKDGAPRPMLPPSLVAQWLARKSKTL